MSSAKQYNLPPFQNIPTQAVSSGTVTSSVTNIYNKDNISIEFDWDGTLAGTFDIQVSNTYNPNAGTGTWTSLTLSPAPIAAGSPSSIFLDLNQLGASYIRSVFTWSSGSGNLTGTISAKAI